MSLFSGPIAPSGARSMGIGWIILGWGLISHAQAQRGATAPSGYYVLNDDKWFQAMWPWVFKDSGIDGISVRFRWADVEPEDGQFNWKAYDENIELARMAGKKVFLRVTSGFQGRGNPPWLYRAGAEKFEYYAGTFGQEMSGKDAMALPVPWDPVFLAKWTALIKAMGERYDKEESVVLVQMAGLDYSGGEMHLPNSPEDKARWLRIGYTKEKLIGAWKTVIDAYAEAFPGKYVALDVSLPIERDGVVEGVLAYAQAKLGRRFCVQHNALSAKPLENGFPHNWVVNSRGKAVIGFQQLCPVTAEGKWNEEGRRWGGGGQDPARLSLGLEVGMRAGMRYLEVYPADMRNPSFRKVFEEFGRKMRAPPSQTP